MSKERYEEVKKELADAEQRLEECNRTYSSLVEDLEYLQADADDLACQIADIEDESYEREIERDELENEIGTLENELVGLGDSEDPNQLEL